MNKHAEKREHFLLQNKARFKTYNHITILNYAWCKFLHIGQVMLSEFVKIQKVIGIYLEYTNVNFTLKFI